LAFTNTREAAEILSSRLRMFDKNLQHEIHHSSLSKEVRIKAEKDFKEEKLKSLITTSSLQLGIDIGSIDLVLQYQSPRTVTQFLQRTGRSGHGIGRTSKGIIIAGEGDDIFESVVIAKKSVKGELEQLKIHRKSMDVLTQQIIGLSIEDYGIDTTTTFDIIKRAYPFKDLKEEEFKTLLNFLDLQLRLIFSDNGIKRRRKAFEYYFENLSVIPDQKSYKIIDTTSNSFVGTLDEEFIASHGDTDSTFIVKGRPWKILSIENDKVFVESVDDIESAIPAWEGELIPVPFDVAQEVGILRREIESMLEKNVKNNEIIENLKKNYPVSSQAAVKMIQLIKNQIKKYPLPDEKNILIETFQNYVVLHTLFGSLVNETLSRFISAILSADYGEIITSKTDPYRIIIKGCSVDDIKKVLFEYKPEDVEIILEKSLPRSSLFKFRFVQVAKRFGAISKKASFETINIDRIIDVYWNSPIHKETLSELFIEKLDLDKSKEILGRIQNNEIKIKSFEGLSPLAELGFRYELHDVAKPERPEKEIFKVFKNRILNSKVRLICLNCGKYSLTETVKDIKELRCSHCQSKLIAVLKPQREESQKIIKKWLKGVELTDEEKEKLEFVKKSADLAIVYDKYAAIVLAGRGIGPQTATRVLSKPRVNEDDLFKYILEAEREFIKNKKYWQ
jgi:ATP-dependent Lhr-like helicase